MPRVRSFIRERGKRSARKISHLPIVKIGEVDDTHEQNLRGGDGSNAGDKAMSARYRPHSQAVYAFTLYSAHALP